MSNYSISKRMLIMLPRMFFENGAVIGIVLIIFILFFSDLQSEVAISYLSFISLASIRLVPSFTALNMNFSNIVYSEKPFEEYVKNIDLDYKELTTTNISIQEKLTKISSIECIELKNIFYRYNNSKDVVLENVNLKFKKNSLVGIIGKSGSGKSTLSKIVMGLLKPTHGELKINNIKVNQISSNWQKKIGYIPQDIFFHL